MKLLLDLGNSRCKYAVLNDKNEIEYGELNYGPFGKLYTVKLLCDKYRLEKVIICSVLSDEMNAEIIETLVNKDGHDVYILVAENNSFGVQLAYDNPAAMGVDRVSALIATKKKYSGNSCVIDCGTAITIDVLDCNGIHKGGIIFPGVQAMQTGLLGSTKIECDEIEVDYNIFANSTEQAIYSGCISAVAGGIEFAINKMASEQGKFDQVIFTGGGVERVEPYIDQSILIDPTLVLDGLKVVAENI